MWNRLLADIVAANYVTTFKRNLEKCWAKYFPQLPPELSPLLALPFKPTELFCVAPFSIEISHPGHVQDQ